MTKTSRDSNPGRIWIVDDSRTQVEHAVRALSAGYLTEAFLDGAPMLERLGVGPQPDVVLLDWQMPGLSGLELCRFIREKFDEVTLPILMLTSRGARADFAEGLAAGANDYVAKPYDEPELRARVNTLLRIRRLAEAALERKQWLHTTLQSIGDAVIAVDAAGRVVFMNAVAEAMTGWTEHEAIACLFGEVCQLVDLDDRAPLGLPAPLGTGLPLRSRIIQRSGTRLPVEHSASPIHLADKVAGAVYVLRDITDRMEHEARARERLDFEEKLVGIVSHDLRNPLHAILLGAEALQGEEGAGPQVTTTARRIQSSANRATRLVSDLLDFTQARLGGGIPLSRQRIDLAALANQVLEEVQTTHPGRTLSIDLSGPLVGSWDPDRISQVLLNLLSNALKYGARDKPVTLRVAGGDGVVIEVHNDGNPIAPTLLPHIFEPMKRGAIGDSSRSIGLGLYIVKHIVDTHDGVVEVRSVVGEGTTFSIHLPRTGDPAPPEVPSEGTSSTKIDPEVLAAAQVDASRMPRRILLVDDSGDLRSTFRRVLEHRGHHVMEAEDGIEGLALILSEKPDVAIVDIGLPGLDGYEVARRVRATLGDSIRLAAMTGYSSDHDRSTALQAGFDLQLTKPVDIALIERLLETVPVTAR
ncbi:MAG: response regulator [Deltaproteobacteria bacterium]|nr:response regulator [Deltaproteobacteria bacterium]